MRWNNFFPLVFFLETLPVCFRAEQGNSFVRFCLEYSPRARALPHLAHVVRGIPMPISCILCCRHWKPSRRVPADCIWGPYFSRASFPEISLKICLQRLGLTKREVLLEQLVDAVRICCTPVVIEVLPAQEHNMENRQQELIDATAIISCLFLCLYIGKRDMLLAGTLWG